MRISIIGYGTVGQGVIELLNQHGDRYAARLGEPVEVAAILVRDVSRSREVAPPAGALVTDSADAFHSTPCDAVVEVAGGIDLAAGWLQTAIGAGRHVVTANKALMAARGEDLYRLAARENRIIRMEAAVGGGVPCVTGLVDGLAANEVTRVVGILNGTCNFILDRMQQQIRSGGDASNAYEEALAEATRLGFAEADPSKDVSGRDAAEKLAILATLAFGGVVDVEAIPCEGVEGIDVESIIDAVSLGRSIRLIAAAERIDARRVRALVRPVEVAPDDEDLGMLSSVHASANGVVYWGDAVGMVSFFGAGAGRRPTASAVMSDILRVGEERHDANPARFNPWPLDGEPLQVVG